MKSRTRRTIYGVITGLGLVLSGMASTAAASAASGSKAPPPTVVNLHQAFNRALPLVGHGPIKYGMRPQGKRPPRVANAAGCTEPNCPVSDQGGPVQQSPRIYLLLWGPGWSTSAAEETSYSYLYYFYAGLGTKPQDTWSTLTAEYGGGTPSFAGAWQDSTVPPSGVTPDDLATEAYSFGQYLGLADLTNSQIVIASQSGTTFSDGFGSYYCAWHDYVVANGSPYAPFINLPYQPDAGYSCGSSYGANAGFSIVGGHEYAETVTDPYISAWYDPADASGGEIGDKCAWYDAKTGADDIGKLNFADGTYPVQPLWSNNAYASRGDGCVLTSDSIAITNPGSQTVKVGTSVSLSISASSAAGQPITYSATGLPKGLSINASTGVISGTASFPGNYTVKVTASDPTPLSRSVTFSWAVTVTAGPVRLWYHTAHCVDDAGGSLTNGTKVDLWSCNGTLAQSWAPFPDSTLRRYGGPSKINTGKCLDIKGASTANGTKVDLYSCNGHWNQVWQYNATHHWWRNPHSGKCLNDPGGKLSNGTQLTISTCSTTSKNEAWQK